VTQTAERLGGNGDCGNAGFFALDPRRTRWKRDNVCAFVAIHLIAALALFPYFFSWTGVILLIAGFYVFGGLGINLCYHRLLSHKSFDCPRWLVRCLVVLGVCNVQDSPPHWVAVHRKHHHHTDDEHDPHSPLVSFFWAHMGWLLVRMDSMDRTTTIARYARDIIDDPFCAWFEWRHRWIKVAVASWAVYFVAGFAFVLVSRGTLAQAAQFGLSLVVWGAALRTVAVWHFTWSINSVTHVWGYRNYPTPDLSRNNPYLALLTSGESWHNNHHADPRSARHGHRWWEVDTTFLIVRLLTGLGLASNVALPSPALATPSSEPTYLDPAEQNSRR
jgi:stearoyl-CoA desaturase (delta-9 desaturase)